MLAFPIIISVSDTTAIFFTLVDDFVVFCAGLSLNTVSLLKYIRMLIFRGVGLIDLNSTESGVC